MTSDLTTGITLSTRTLDITSDADSVITMTMSKTSLTTPISTPQSPATDSTALTTPIYTPQITTNDKIDLTTPIYTPEITTTGSVPSTQCYTCRDKPCNPRNVGAFFCHTGYTTRFIRCAERKRCHVFRCPSILVWDVSIDTCNWPWNV